MLDVKFKFFNIFDVIVKTTKQVTLLQDTSSTGKTFLFNILESYFSGTSKETCIVSPHTYKKYQNSLRDMIMDRNYLVMLDGADYYIDHLQDIIYHAKADILVSVKGYHLIHIDSNVGFGFILNKSDRLELVEGSYVRYIRGLL